MTVTVTRSMVHSCCAPGCTNRSSRDKLVSCIRFPRDPRLTRKWLEGKKVCLKRYAAAHIGDFNKYVKVMSAKGTAMLGVLGVELKVL